MPRTSQEEVEEVIEVDEDLWSDSLLTHAETLVNAVDRVNPGNYTDEELIMMETYIAAHLYAIKEQKPMQEKAGRSSVKYQGNTSGIGLRGTMWGQMALAIDTLGVLVSITEKRTSGMNVGAIWIGTRE